MDELEESVLQSVDQQSNNPAYSAVYEQMLRVVHQNPSRLKNISMNTSLGRKPKSHSTADTPVLYYDCVVT